MMPTCKGCGREIEWVTTSAGAQMPVDPDPVTVVLKDGRVVRGQMPHWVTCPAADRFKKRAREA